MYDFLSGAVMLVCLVIALFFLRFYRRTSDRLFAWFAISFLILGLERFALILTSEPEANSPFTYLGRLVAFGLIIIAVVERNRR
ncbi:MAG TPA: DUF5985 family protein [Candidatus Baltobacteraceae bacterium]|nr:DUF5985 family protein [Candidatus Baltobacteraceae bacterium]